MQEENLQDKTPLEKNTLRIFFLLYALHFVSILRK